MFLVAQPSSVGLEVFKKSVLSVWKQKETVFSLLFRFQVCLFSTFDHTAWRHCSLCNSG